MIDEVVKTIKKFNLIEKNESVAVGVSGGPDSVALLHVLGSLKEYLGIKLMVVHVNHMLRGEEAFEDQKYVEGLCKDLNMELHVKSVDTMEFANKNKLSVEVAARELRYDFYDVVARTYGVDKIALAHNMNDQAETVLMNIIRGTGLDGLKGIEYVRGKYIRPLLDVSRIDIERYCKENGFNTRTDSSNMESIYTRNKIRLKLIPCINELFNTNITEGIYKMSSLIKDDLDFLSNQMDSIFKRCKMEGKEANVVINIAELKKYHIAVIRRVLRIAIARIKGNIVSIESVHVESIIKMMFGEKSGAVLQLPGDIRVGKSYNNLNFFISKKDIRIEDYDIKINVPGETYLHEILASIIVRLEDRIIENRYDDISQESLIQYFDFDKIKGELWVRNRREGDIFKPLNSNSTKTIKKYFIEKKIPREQRAEKILLALGSEIVWIMGMKISENYKVDESTKKVIILEIKK